MPQIHEKGSLATIVGSELVPVSDPNDATPHTIKHLTIDRLLALQKKRLTRTLKIGFAGDSIADMYSNINGRTSPFNWVKNVLYPCDIKLIFSSTLGGSSSSHLISTQIAQLEALPVSDMPDMMVIQSIQNDFIGSLANAQTFAGYVTAYADRAIAAGVPIIVICGKPPKTSTDVASAVAACNAILNQYCMENTGCYFIDVFGTCRNPPTVADTTGVTWKGTTGGDTGYSTDGTHPSALAARAIAPFLEEILRAHAKPVNVLPTSAVDYNKTSAPYANLLGADGLMVGTNGRYNGVLNTNVAGVTDASMSRWELTDGNGITAEPLIVTGDDGYRYQELTLSGTASADATITLLKQYAHDVTLGSFIAESVIETESLAGINNIQMLMQSFVTAEFGGDSVLLDNPPSRIHVRSAITSFSSSWGTQNNTLKIFIKSGKTVSGKIRLGRVGVYKVG